MKFLLANSLEPLRPVLTWGEDSRPVGADCEGNKCAGYTGTCPRASMEALGSFSKAEAEGASGLWRRHFCLQLEFSDRPKPRPLCPNTVASVRPPPPGCSYNQRGDLLANTVW